MLNSFYCFYLGLTVILSQSRYDIERQQPPFSCTNVKQPFPFLVILKNRLGRYHCGSVVPKIDKYFTGLNEEGCPSLSLALMNLTFISFRCSQRQYRIRKASRVCERGMDGLVLFNRHFVAVNRSCFCCHICVCWKVQVCLSDLGCCAVHRTATWECQWVCYNCCNSCEKLNKGLLFFQCNCCSSCEKNEQRVCLLYCFICILWMLWKIMPTFWWLGYYYFWVNVLEVSGIYMHQTWDSAIWQFYTVLKSILLAERGRGGGSGWSE